MDVCRWTGGVVRGWTLDVGSSCEMFMKARLIYHARTQQSPCTRVDFITLADTNRDRHQSIRETSNGAPMKSEKKLNHQATHG